METLFIEGAPAAIGPYCHAVKTGNLVFCSGQTPLDPETMKIAGTTIEGQISYSNKEKSPGCDGRDRVYC